MTNNRLLLLFLGLVATSTALCAFTPQSTLDGNPQTKTDNQLYPVRVVGVDGDMQHENPVMIYPGPHWLEIVLAPSDDTVRRETSKSKTYVLKIQPCTRYYLGAHKDSLLRDKWKLVVDAEETVQSCDPAEELKKAEANPPRGGKAHPPH